MSSKDVLLGMLLVVVVILAYLFLTQSQVQMPEAPAQPPTAPQQPTQPPQDIPQQPTDTTPQEPDLPATNVTPPATTEPNDTGPIILTPINISQEGNGTLVRVPPTSRSNDTSILISIYPARIVVDPYDFLNDSFDFSKLKPVRGETVCKNQCDTFCLIEKNFCKDKCEEVHNDVCLDAKAQELICKAACLQADLTLWDLIDCSKECEKEMAKACGWFTLAKCKGQCGSIYYNRCIDECYDRC
jgi:hypothetical protein